VGLFGTTLTITDPVGRLVQKSQENYVKHLRRHEDIEHGKLKPNSYSYFQHKAIKTSWIKYEIDKIVSMVYFIVFLSTVIFFMSVHVYPNILCKTILGVVEVNGSLVYESNATALIHQNKGAEEQLNTCETNLGYLLIPLFIADAGVIYCFIREYRKLFERRETVASYFELVREIRILENEKPKESEGTRQQKYENYKALANEIVEYLNKKEWTLAKILVDSINLYDKTPNMK
jgi:hypothetical protein